MPDPAPVVDLLRDLLLARFPPARTTVGLDAYGAAALGALLPDSLADLIFGVIF